MIKPSTIPTPEKWFIFDTHPIQYRSPVFRELAEILPGSEVIYFSNQFDGDHWWFHEVNKIPKQTWGIPLQNGFSNRVLESRTLWGKLKEISRLFLSEKPSAVLVYGYYLPEHWMVWAVARWQKIPLVFIGENYEVSEATVGFKAALKTLFRDQFLKSIKTFVSIGERNRKFYQSLGVSAAQIESAKYCIDNSFFKTDELTQLQVRTSVRKAWKVAENDLVLLFVGRLFDRKRPFDLVELRNRLGNANIQIVVVGNGELETALREQSRGLTRFHVLGFKNQSEIRDCYWASDMLLVPSEYETWGLVTNEAFAAGMTAAVTDTCGTAGDLVIPGKTGIVFPVGDVDVLARSIQTLLAEPEKLQELKRNARDKVLTEYTPRLFAEKIANAFGASGTNFGEQKAS